MTEQLVPEKEKKLRWWQVLWGVIRHPGSTFQQTGGRVGLGLPAFLMIGGTVFLTVATTLSQQGKLTAEMQKRLAETPKIPPEQIERIVAISTSPAAVATGAVMAIIGVLIAWIIQSGILHLLVRALGGKGVFRQAFGIVGWAWIPLFIGCVIRGTYALATGKVPITEGMGLWHAITVNTNVFNAWNLVLLIIGFSAVYGMTKMRAAIPVVGMWVLTVLLTYAAGSIGQGLGPGTPTGVP